MRMTYVSILTTDSYLPGLLVLHKSLIDTKTKFPFLVLLTDNISAKAIRTLEKNKINYKILDQKIINPSKINPEHRWYSTYYKLAIFNQIEFEKIVFLDADMLILRNIDELFSKRHLSAVNAGGMLARKSSWTHLNSGLMVIRPSKKLFNNMIKKIGKIESLDVEGDKNRATAGSDQDFINAYYPKWPQKKYLHLDHRYNIIHYFIDEYCSQFKYTIENGKNNISVIHYASYIKPWTITKKEIDELQSRDDKMIELKTILLWKEKFNLIKI